MNGKNIIPKHGFFIYIYRDGYFEKYSYLIKYTKVKTVNKLVLFKGKIERKKSHKNYISFIGQFVTD